MSDGMSYTKLPATIKSECVAQNTGVCVASYEGDATDAKLAALPEIGMVRFHYPQGGTSDWPMCEPCLAKEAADRGWVEVNS